MFLIVHLVALNAKHVEINKLIVLLVIMDCMRIKEHVCRLVLKVIK